MIFRFLTLSKQTLCVCSLLFIIMKVLKHYWGGGGLAPPTNGFSNKPTIKIGLQKFA